MRASGGHHPLTLVLWQVIIGASLLFGLLTFKRIRLPLSRRHISFYAAAGFLGTALPNGFSYWVAPHLPAGIISIGLSMVPMMTFSLAVVCRQEPPDWRRFGGVLCGVTAVAVLVFPDTSLPDPSAVFWVVVLLFVALSYALQNVFVAHAMPGDESPITMLCGMSIAAAIMLTPVIGATGVPFALFETGSRSELALVGSSVVHIVCYATLIYLIRHAGAVFSSQVSILVTLAGVLWGIVIFGETHSIWAWGSLVLTVAGLAIVRPRTRGKLDHHTE